jgi:hypothetical protein
MHRMDFAYKRLQPGDPRIKPPRAFSAGLKCLLINGVKLSTQYLNAFLVGMLHNKAWLALRQLSGRNAI